VAARDMELDSVAFGIVMICFTVPFANVSVYLMMSSRTLKRTILFP